MRQAVKKMKEREVFVAHISPLETDGRERERERERKREREIFAHMYLEEANGGEREVCCRWAHCFFFFFFLCLLQGLLALL